MVDVRYVLDGSGYFDVRDKTDRWIRVEVTKGDLLVLPAGIYHRFTVTTASYSRVLRLFLHDAAVWTSLPRPQDAHPTRAAYLAAYPAA